MYLINMKKLSGNDRMSKASKKIFDPRAKEFVNIVRKGTYPDLLKLYYNYKGYYMTGTADFVQQIVVEFMEEYCIEIKDKTQTQTQQPTIHPSKEPIKKQQNKLHSRRALYPSQTKFGDDWNIDFEDDKPNMNHPSVLCESD